MVENTQDYVPKQYPDNTTTRSVRKRKPISNPTPIPKPDKRPNELSTTPSSDNATPGTKSVKKLISPHLQFGKEVDTRHFTTSEPPNSYNHEEITVRCEQPSLDCSEDGKSTGSISTTVKIRPKRLPTMVP